MGRKSSFLQYLGESPKIKVLDFLMDNFALDFKLSEAFIQKGEITI